jgi:hypothetical protein
MANYYRSSGTTEVDIEAEFIAIRGLERRPLFVKRMKVAQSHYAELFRHIDHRGSSNCRPLRYA